MIITYLLFSGNIFSRIIHMCDRIYKEKYHKLWNLYILRSLDTVNVYISGNFLILQLESIYLIKNNIRSPRSLSMCDDSFRWRRAQIGIHAMRFERDNCWPIRRVEMNPMSLGLDRRPLNVPRPNTPYNHNHQQLDSLLSSKWPRMLSKS